MGASLQLLTWDLPPLRDRAGTLADRFAGRNRTVTVVPRPPAAAADPVGTAFLEPPPTFPETLRTALTDGPADIALAPLPVQSLPDSLHLAAVLDRTHNEDWLVTVGETSLESLTGGTLAAPSPRLRAQLTAATPQTTDCLEITAGTPRTAIEDVWATDLQQTAATKRAAAADDAFETWHQTLSDAEQAALERSVDPPINGIVAPAAAVAPLAPTRVTTTAVSPESFCPGPGQGAVGVVTSRTDLVEDLRSRFDDPLTRVETTVERTLAASLPAAAAVGVTATVQGTVVTARVWLQHEGDTPITESYEFPIRNHRRAARRAGTELAHQAEA